MSKKIDFEDLKNEIFNSLDSSKEREILSRRFALNGQKFQTLGEIGDKFCVTRERIRQIEKASLEKLGNSKTLKPYFDKINKIIDAEGGVVSFDALAVSVGAKKENNKILLNLTLIIDNNSLQARDPRLKKSWHLINISPDTINKIIKISIIVLLDAKRSFSLSDLSREIGDRLTGVNEKLIEAIVLTSVKIDKDIDGKYGLTKWGTVRPRNTRDKAYVIFRRVKKPLHYRKLTELISKGNFVKKKNVSVEAVHNELIRDSRFVLVGRGLYALKEWGYKPGVVADVIEEILRKERGPLHKNEIVDRVLERRFVKKNTILLNLQEKPRFKRVRRAVYGLNKK